MADTETLEAPVEAPVVPVTTAPETPPPAPSLRENPQAYIDAHPEQFSSAPPPAAPEAPPVEAPPQAAPEAWLTDDLKELAQAYDFDEGDLDLYTSEAQLRAAMRSIDKQLRGAARAHYEQQPPPAPPAAPPTPPVAAASPATITPPASQPAATAAPATTLAGLDAVLSELKAAYPEDETLYRAMSAIRSTVDASLAELRRESQAARQWIDQEQQARQQQAAAQEVELIGQHLQTRYPELFGTDFNNLSPTQKTNIVDRFRPAYMELKAGIFLTRGKAPASIPALVDRVVHQEFSDHFIQQARQATAAKNREQAKQKLGTPGTRATGTQPHTGTPHTDPEVLGAIARYRNGK